jgi:sigma-B regulation protein RsbU (phosphoserine phosphatase)
MLEQAKKKVYTFQESSAYSATPNPEQKLKNSFLKTLLKAEEISTFHQASELSTNFLEELEGFSGVVLRIYSGKIDGSWHYIASDKAFLEEIESATDFSGNLSDSETLKLESWHRKRFNGEDFFVFVSPYITDGYHLGDLILIIKSEFPDECQNLEEWHLFSDLLANKLFSKYQFAEHLLTRSSNDSDRLLSFIRETQLILTANNRAIALTIEQEKLQASQWFEEDKPVLVRFMTRVQQELNLHTVFILQNAAPGFMHELVVTSLLPEQEMDDDVREMIDAVKQFDALAERSIISRDIIRNEAGQDRKERLIPLVFSCQAGGISFGHLGIFTSKNNLGRYINHRSKILPMLANQLGFYFSHLHQLRREALEARMLQQINQTCNTINSSVDIGAILFKLVESLNNLFRQYSGAILINSLETQELEVTTQLGGPVPENFDIHSAMNEHPYIYDLINEGAVFDNRDGRYPLPIRYILPLSATPQAQVISPDLLTPRSLGAVILYEHSANKHLSEETLQKLIPILLNGIGASLQVARNYAEKLDTIKALEGLMSKLSDSDSLFDEMIAIIRRLLKVNRISFLTLDETEQFLFIRKEFGLPPGIKESTKIPIGGEISGFVAQHGKSIRIDNIEKEGAFRKRSMEDYLNRSLLSVPLVSKRGKGEEKVIGVINVNNKANGLTFTQQDQQLLEAIAHLVVTALEKVRFLEAKHEKELLDRQLKDARDIQMSLLPKSFAELPQNIEMFGKSIPARQIGGDFFDIIPLDDGRILAALGDVSGKGMPAAILMAVSRMVLRSVVQDTVDLTTILEKVNNKLSKELDSYHFVTLQIVAIDPRTGKAEMSSAGHGPLMVRLNKEIRLIETKGGPPLGIQGLPVQYDKQEFQMTDSDCLIMFTDGLSEEHSENNEMFGSDRIESFLDCFSELSASEITENLIAEAIKWRGSKEAHDDLTLLTLKFKGTR